MHVVSKLCSCYVDVKENFQLPFSIEIIICTRHKYEDTFKIDYLPKFVYTAWYSEAAAAVVPFFSIWLETWEHCVVYYIEMHKRVPSTHKPNPPRNPTHTSASRNIIQESFPFKISNIWCVLNIFFFSAVKMRFQDDMKDDLGRVMNDCACVLMFSILLQRGSIYALRK